MFSEFFSKKITATFLDSHCYFVIFAKNYYTDIAMVEIIAQIFGYAFIIFIIIMSVLAFEAFVIHNDDID